jgi:feruloyl esterase
MIGHPERVIDAGYRGKHLQAVAAKAVIESYYGKAPERSYHAGCSGGGRQGLMELQRYPDDYDGYVVGAPANNWTAQSTAWINKSQAFADPAAVIPMTMLPTIRAAAMAQCDALDGITDDIIGDPRQCNFNLDVLACPAGKDDNSTCLTPPQLASLKRLFDGPFDSEGRLLFPGDEPGTNVIDGVRRGLPNQHGGKTVGGLVYHRSDWDYRTFDFDVDPLVMEAAIGGIFNANDPDLRVQKEKGIKVIQYHGWTDEALAPRESINYYERVVEQMGGVEQTHDFFRLFMAPGMDHCGGGLGPNYFGQAGGGSVGSLTPTSDARSDVLMALEKWVEEDVAPDQLIATKYTNNVITEPVQSRRPLCPYPQVQKYDGSGDPNVETSFSCVQP